MQGAVRPFLFRIRKGTKAFEAAFLDKIEQVAEFRFPFPGMSHDQGSPQNDAGNQLAHPQVSRLPAVHTAPHHGQDTVGTVLQRDVDIRTDLRIVGHQVEHILREAGGIAVVQPDPRKAVDFGQLFQQTGKAALAITVQAVIGRILCDDDQFLGLGIEAASGTVGRQPACFFHQVFKRNAHMRTADQRNGAIGAGAVAAFGNLQVGIVRRRREDAVERIEGQDTAPFIHFWYLGLEF